MIWLFTREERRCITEIARESWSAFSVTNGVLSGYVATGTRSCPGFAVRVSEIGSAESRLLNGQALALIVSKQGEKFLTYGDAELALRAMKGEAPPC